MSKRPNSRQPASNPFPWRHRVIYGVGVALVVVLFAIGTRQYRRVIDRYQFSRIRYAAERAIDQVRSGDLEAARENVALLNEERPIGRTEGLFSRQFSDVTEGPVLRNRVSVYEELTAELLAAAMLPEAEIIGWKTLLEYHLWGASRGLELITPWNLIHHIKLAQGDLGSAWEAARVIAAHGENELPTPDRLEPLAYPFDAQLIEEHRGDFQAGVIQVLKDFYEATTESELRQVSRQLAGMASRMRSPLMRRRLQSLYHRVLTAAGLRAEARQLLGEIWGTNPTIMDPFWAVWPTTVPPMDLLVRDPSLLDFLWRDRPADSRVTIGSFVDSFAVDARVQIEDLRGLTKIQTGYFDPDADFMMDGEAVLFYRNVGAALEVTTEQPVYQIFLACSATPALGIYPILLVRIDDGPYMPVYCDAQRPELIPIDVRLATGTHRFEFVYLNDSGFTWRRSSGDNLEEDRNLWIHRMVLVHTQPRD